MRQSPAPATSSYRRLLGTQTLWSRESIPARCGEQGAAWHWGVRKCWGGDSRPPASSQSPCSSQRTPGRSQLTAPTGSTPDGAQDRRVSLVAAVSAASQQALPGTRAHLASAAAAPSVTTGPSGGQRGGRRGAADGQGRAPAAPRRRRPHGPPLPPSAGARRLCHLLPRHAGPARCSPSPGPGRPATAAAVRGSAGLGRAAARGGAGRGAGGGGRTPQPSLPFGGLRGAARSAPLCPPALPEGPADSAPPPLPDAPG